VRLVLADNDQDALDLLELDLRLEGHEIVALAADGESAVDACERARPDVLVVDYRMPPGIDGVEVARRVIAGGTAGAVLLHSNYLDRAVVARAEALGARWLRKGDLAALRAAVSGHGRAPSAG
jgi:CheY-like chemotaxis protein